jgi:hypothetical protein
METKIKILTAIIIPYAFFCAGLYQIAFWTPFNINGFSFLDISDIIKSFIQPFLFSSSLALFGHIIHFNTTFQIWPYGGGNIEPPSKKKRDFRLILETLYVLALIYFVTLFDYKWKGLFVPTFFIPGLYLTISELFLRYNLIIHEKNRFFVLYLLVMLPILSFTSGTRNAYQIFENKQYDYSTIIIPDKTLKFVGKASSHYIFISEDNKEKYFFSTGEIKGLKLQEYKCN